MSDITDPSPDPIASPTDPPRPEDAHRWITLERLDQGVYRARNPRGVELRFGSKADDAFSPVELLLAAIAGCSAVDVDVVTGRRSPAEVFQARVDATAVRENGNLLKDITLTFRVSFPDGEAGDAAREILPRAVQTSHDRTCTVSRTIEAGTPVTVRIS
ncbi:MAG TPA: OsmC family protein [Kineosporiaceae bacterium]